MKLSRYTRRGAMQLGAGVGVLLSTSTSIAGSVEGVLYTSALEKRLLALSQCTWEGFDVDKILLSEQSISIGGVQIDFSDEEKNSSGNNCGKIISRNDISESTGISFASRGDGWGSPNDLLPVRKKIS